MPKYSIQFPVRQGNRARNTLRQRYGRAAPARRIRAPPVISTQDRSVEIWRTMASLARRASLIERLSGERRPTQSRVDWPAPLAPPPSSAEIEDVVLALLIPPVPRAGLVLEDRERLDQRQIRLADGGRHGRIKSEGHELRARLRYVRNLSCQSAESVRDSSTQPWRWL